MVNVLYLGYKDTNYDFHQNFEIFLENFFKLSQNVAVSVRNLPNLSCIADKDFSKYNLIVADHLMIDLHAKSLGFKRLEYFAKNFEDSKIIVTHTDGGFPEVLTVDPVHNNIFYVAKFRLCDSISALYK